MHDLVPAAVGKRDVDIIIIVVQCRLLRGIDGRQDIVRHERPVPDHPHPDTVFMHPLVGQDGGKLLLKKRKERFQFALLPPKVLGGEGIECDVPHAEFTGPVKDPLRCVSPEPVSDRCVEPLVPSKPPVSVLDHRHVPRNVLHLPPEITFVERLNPGTQHRTASPPPPSLRSGSARRHTSCPAPGQHGRRAPTTLFQLFPHRSHSHPHQDRPGTR